MWHTLHFNMTFRISKKTPAFTAQKMELFFRDFRSKYKQTPSKLWIVKIYEKDS